MMFADSKSAELHRKRFREDEDEASGLPVGFTEHRSKRLQSLPLRSSPNSKRWNDQSTFPLLNPTLPTTFHVRAVTPQEPIQEDMWADEPELVPPGGPSSGIGAAPAVNHPDSDTDMMDTSEAPGPPPGPFQPDHAAPSATGRIPTPIHCSFAAQVRGTGWSGRTAMGGGVGGGGGGDVLATTPEEPTASAFGGGGGVAAAGVPAVADWSMVENRRLPSPISECGVEDSQGSGRMVLDASSGQQQQHSGISGGGGRLCQVTHEHPLVAELPSRTGSAMEGRAGREDTPGSDKQGMEVESTGAGSPRKGHTRSKHTLNSWTALQPGMTRSFSIGYRADCEKCRNKQPGHFNHIIIS